MKNLFSERYGYIKPKQLQLDEMPGNLKNRIWNFFRKFFESVYGSELMLEIIWDKFFKKDLDKLTRYWWISPNAIKNEFYNLKWYEVYDFIEFCLNESSISYIDIDREDFIDELNKIFEEERVPYRIIKGLVTPLTSEIEIKEIEQALNVPDVYQPVRNHINKALEFYSKRPRGDFKKSIEESILALEALAKIITGKEKETLGNLTKGLSIHPALKEGLKKIYGWASDERGIRHAETQYPAISANEEEARLMLVLASVFVNYIIVKHEKSKT